ncbi:UPF0462 protein C4orf33 homolog [Exaiptasia diaphana]|uniref:Uncharacterized protein n=1 Tax=Exaiptasia diaphana TaxID=2652724 RepID=A0A913XQT8_EXADI|nr:UPF0462 protein C4orf33 homolog [Exaiptasia diaphana]
MAEKQVIKLAISTSWNGKKLDHDPVGFYISASADGASIKLEVKAPFFNDPGCPPSPAGPCDELWEYEVAEVFFLGEDDRYLEVELNPHGHHLVLLLDGQRNMFKDKLDMDFSAKIDKENKTWTGSALIPLEYFPPCVVKANAFAIHGSDEERQYEALYPADDKFSTPDFHRLQFFKELDFKSMFPSDWTQPVSSLWSERITTN